LARLGNGDYEGAFALMTPRYRSQNPNWASLRATADPGINVIDVSPEHAGGGVALVSVDFFARDRVPTPGSDTMCREFSGTLTVLKVGGHWRYDPEHQPLDKRNVPRSDPQCPS
jgi:hypothetical protein